MKTKICTKCGLEHPITNFARNKNTKSGFQTECKCCRKKRNKLDKAKPKPIDTYDTPYESTLSDSEIAKIFMANMMHAEQQSGVSPRRSIAV